MKTNRNFKFSRRLAVAAGCLVMLAPVLEAAPFLYNSGDLILALRQSGQPDLVVNIGPGANYDALVAGTTITITNLKVGQLSTAFPSLDTLSWSVSGSVRVPGNVNYPLQTVWATSPRAVPTVPGAPWLRHGQFAQAGAASVIAAVGNNAATYSSVQAAGTNNTATGVIIPVTDPNAYTPLVSEVDNIAASDFNASFQGNVENITPADFDSAEPLSRSDLYKLLPATGTNVNTVGAVVGHFDFKPDGTLTFTAGSLPPAPTITGVQRNGNIVTVSFTTASSFTYSLLVTNAAGLASPLATWPANGTTVTGDGTVRSLQDTNATDNSFYAVGVNP